MEKFLILIIACLISAYAGSYFRKKGENLAEKQDISEITKIVEEIKHQNNLLLEQFKGRNQLRLAALDKRLEVHQQAYYLLDELLSSIINNKDVRNIQKKCSDWWEKHNLYLYLEARDAFRLAYMGAPENYYELDRDQKNMVRDDLNKAFSLLQEAVELPPINPELDVFKKESK